jgi:aryl-alcohol dehydrogenase-like predicted oxidoreductase
MQFGWTADEKTSLGILSQAFDAGINFIDTADIYSKWAPGNQGGVSERIIGKWLKQSRIPREQVVIATKVRGRMGEHINAEGLSRSHIFNSVEGSLQGMGIDYIDVYQSHWFDESTPISETLLAFSDLIQMGKVRYIGCSNYPAWRLTESILTAELIRCYAYQSLQPHYNLVHRAEYERELLDVCRRFDLAVIPYSPLAAGFLTGKYRPDKKVDSSRAKGASKYFKERNFALLDLIKKIGLRSGNHTSSQVALSWLLHQPTITSLIIGPRTLSQLEDNLLSIQVDLDEYQLRDLDESSKWD